MKLKALLSAALIDSILLFFFDELFVKPFDPPASIDIEVVKALTG